MFTASIALGLAAALGPTQDFGDYHALVIGNDKYENYPKLNSAVSDARAVAKILEEDYGFKVTPLFNATSDQIGNALFELRRIPATDNILIYYAGHGSLDTATEQGYWFGVDASDWPRTRLSNSDIRTEVAGMQAKHVLILSDSCFSGSLTRAAEESRGLVVTGRESTISPDLRRKLDRLSSKITRLVITSGGNEPVTDRGKDGHSVFAYKLLSLLRENKSVTTGQSLFYSLKDYVSLNARQDPTIGRMREVDDDGGDFLFVRRTLSDAAPATPPLPSEGPTLEVGAGATESQAEASGHDQHLPWMGLFGSTRDEYRIDFAWGFVVLASVLQGLLVFLLSRLLQTEDLFRLRHLRPYGSLFTRLAYLANAEWLPIALSNAVVLALFVACWGWSDPKAWYTLAVGGVAVNAMCWSAQSAGPTLNETLYAIPLVTGLAALTGRSVSRAGPFHANMTPSSVALVLGVAAYLSVFSLIMVRRR